MNDLNFYSSHDFTDTAITSIYCDEFEDKDERYITLSIEGDFGSSEPEYRHYNIIFIRSCSKLPAERINSLDKPVLRTVKAEKNGNGFYAEIEIEAENDALKLKLECESISASGLHYRGFDHTNIFGTDAYREMAEKSYYAESADYFSEETETELPEGFSLFIRHYIHKSEKAVYAYFSRCEFRRDGKSLYEYISIDGHHQVYKDFIHHSNGHRYYPFNIDLYGISYIDVDTLEVYNYIPRGFDNDYGAPNGESFIITDIHYDKNTDLIAYGGCYWAAPGDVIVGDFSEPLHFDPHFVSVHEMFDPEYEEFDDVDFDCWRNGILSVETDTKKRFEISADTITAHLEKM